MKHQINAEAEMAAMGFMMLAIIQTHPDKSALRACLDSLVSDFQTMLITSGGASALPLPIRDALSKYYSELDRLAQ